MSSLLDEYVRLMEQGLCAEVTVVGPDDALVKESWLPFRSNKPPEGIRGIGSYLGPSLGDDEPSGEEDEEEDDDGIPPVKVLNGYWNFVPKTVSLRDAAEEEDNAVVGRRYAATRDPKDLETLMSRYEPHIEGAVRGLSNLRIPHGAVRGEVYGAFAEAARTWNPDKADLSTHFGARLQNSRRWLVQYSQFSKGGRDRVSKMEQIRSFRSDFEDEHGREASAQEIANELRLDKKTVALIMKEDARDLLGSRDMGSDRFVDPEIKLRRALERVRDALSTTNQKILDRIYGLNGQEPMKTNREIATDVGVSPTHVSTQRGVISSLLRDEMQRKGW